MAIGHTPEHLKVSKGGGHGSQFNFAPCACCNVEMEARILPLRKHEGMNAGGLVGTEVRVCPSPDVGGGKRWWGPLGRRSGGGNLLFSISWEVEGLGVVWGDSEPEVENCGNVRVVL